jgi:hypothetical protein
MGRTRRCEEIRDRVPAWKEEDRETDLDLRDLDLGRDRDRDKDNRRQADRPDAPSPTSHSRTLEAASGLVGWRTKLQATVLPAAREWTRPARFETTTETPNKNMAHPVREIPPNNLTPTTHMSNPSLVVPGSTTLTVQ